MDKDFDKLQEFVEIMKVSIYTGQYHPRICGRWYQALPQILLQGRIYRWVTS